MALSCGGDPDLGNQVLATHPGGQREIAVPACGGRNRRKARTATLTLRCTLVDPLLPKERKTEARICMVTVSIREKPPSPPGDVSVEAREGDGRPAARNAADDRGRGRYQHHPHGAALIRSALADRTVLPRAAGRNPH